MGRLALPLIVCVLLGRASCEPPATAAPQVTTTATTSSSSWSPSEPESTSAWPHREPTTAGTSDAGAKSQREGTSDQVTAGLDDFSQSAGHAATAGPFAALTNTLAEIQKSLAAVSSRLDIMQELHSSLEKRLSALEHSVESAQTTLPERLAAVLQQSPTCSSQPDQPDVQTQLEDILAAISRIPKAVLGEVCTRDTDCSRWLPEATCSASGVCTCRDGYHPVSPLQCRQHSQLDEVCLEDVDCQTLTTNSICNGSCICDSGFWNYNNTECRRVAGVNMGRRCVGDQDCHQRLNHQCISGTCSCETRTDDGYEYRLVGGPSCSEGNVEVRRTGDSWGLVCDDDWSSNDAEVLCRSLGFTSGEVMTGSKYGSGTSYVMDDVKCSGSEEHLIHCPYLGWGSHNCGQTEAAGARCQDWYPYDETHTEC